MTQIAEIGWRVQGDVGGAGISRFRFTRQDSAAITVADCTAAANASKGILSAIASSSPTTITWLCVAQVNVYDYQTGLVQSPLTITSPPSGVTGSASGNYAAGTGARLNWKTATVSGRRLLKGSTFLVPLAQNGYAGTGTVGGALQTTINAAAATYLTAMQTALLVPVIWHRPATGTSSGGMVGGITTAATGSQVCGLRSRRH